jgi:hypothetical protein
MFKLYLEEPSEEHNILQDLNTEDIHGFLRGRFEIIYSIKINKKRNKNSSSKYFYYSK